METQVKALTAARNRLVPSLCPTAWANTPILAVQVTLKGLTRQYGKPRKQSRGLTVEAPASGKGACVDSASPPGKAAMQGD